MAVADTAQKAVSGVTNGISSAFGFVSRNAWKVLAVGGLALLLATSGGGAAALGGANISQLASGATEGIVKGSQMLAHGATWVAGKIGTTAAAVPGVGVPS
jgi:hypothetical protein